MHDHDFHERRWPTLVVRCSVCLAIVASGVWWFVKRERPVMAQQPLALLRDPTARPTARRLAAETLQRADISFVSELVQELREGDTLGRELAALVLGRPECKARTVLEALVQATNDGETCVRRQAVIALGLPWVRGPFGPMATALPTRIWSI